jgi:CDP-glucose 4,6-dehydratase
VESLGLNTTFWRDRPTFVTGGTGMLGGWLVERLLRAGADVTCLVRDWVPQSQLVRGLTAVAPDPSPWGAGLAARVKVVYGDVRSLRLLERVLGEYEKSHPTGPKPLFG